MRKHSILIVDDDKEFLAETKEALSTNGYRVLTTETGAGAKDLLKWHRPSVMLLDKKLPDMDGQECVKDLKKYSRHTSIIIITGYGALDSSIKALRAGIDDYILKPADPDYILKKVQDIIAVKQKQTRSKKDLKKWGLIQLQKYKALFDTANDAIFIADTKTNRLVDCNKTACELLGYKREEIIGKDQTFLHPRDKKKEYRELFKRHIKTGHVIEDILLLAKDGEKIPVRVSASTMRIDGRLYIQGTFRDRRETRKIEESLRASEQKYKDLIRLIPGVMYMARLPESSPIYVNERITDLVGFSQGEWLAQKEIWQSQIHPEDRERIKAEHARALKNGKKLENIYRILHKDASTVKWVKDTAVMVEDSQTGSKFLTGIITDITDVVKERERNELFSKAIGNVSDGVIITDKRTRIIYCNRSIIGKSGYKEDELINKGISTFLSEFNPPYIPKDIETELSSGGTWKGEIVFKCKDERFFPAYFLMDPIKNSSGTTEGAVGIITDITEKRLMEEELRHHSENLEKIVKEKTKNLENFLCDFERVNRELKRSGALKSEFVARAGHELINPLAVVRDSLAYCLDKKESGMTEEVKKFLNISKREVDRLLRLTNDMLDISKIELNKAPVNIRRINMKQLLEDCLATFKKSFKNKKVTLTTNIKKAPEEMFADADMMKQVLINLLSNAMKYTPPKKSVKLKAAEINGKFLLEITDEGPGIPKEEQERIFDKFYRIFSERETGTGLGLAITKEIVDLHKGRIWVESGKDKGSTFFVEVPLGL